MTVQRVWGKPDPLKSAGLLGRIFTTLENFTTVFGMPTEGPEHKTKFEWYFTTSYGFICVYDYYYNERDPHLSIGGTSRKASKEAIAYFCTRGLDAKEVTHGKR